MLRRNKTLSIVMTLCLCLAILAPVFVAPQAAEAAATYQALTIPSLSANTAGYNAGPPVVPGQDLGIIQVDIPSGAAVTAGDVLTITLPNAIEMVPAAGSNAVITVPATAVADTGAVAAAGTVEVYVPFNVGSGINGLTAALTGGVASAKVTNKQTLDITFNAATANPGRLLIYIKGVKVGSVDGDVTASVSAPSNSAFSTGDVVVGKVGTGATVSSIKSVKTFGTSGATDVITVTETAAGTITAGDVIKVKLPVGYTWVAGIDTKGNFGWGFGTAAAAVAPNGADARILDVTVPAASAGLAGKVSFTGMIVVDDSVAKTGEIVAHIYDTTSDVTECDLTIAKYGTYGVQVTENTKTDIYAGKHDQKTGSFYISEDLMGSLITGRSIKLTLPNGVKWSGAYSALMPAVPTAESGTATLGAYTIADSNTTLKTVVTTGTKSKFKFKDLKVDIAPDFSGPLTLTVSGDAGAAGEVVIANVKPAVELKSEDIKDVQIGEQAQDLGSITITESAKEKIALNSAAITTWAPAAIAAQPGVITLTLPAGAEWAPGYPTVEVTDGDLQLKTNSMSKSGSVLTIPVKSESTKPSTIKVSNMKATIYRTVPEGAFQIEVAGTALNETGGTLLATNLAFPQYEANKVTVAKCITPAQSAGSTQFRIGSNIFTVNGVAKIMDVAPYIKDNRTYVPYRFLAQALGVNDADIVWDAAANTVTITKGDKVVVATIGSKTMTVNGEATEMDVAPEITANRTMLPARFLAEALGFTVGWDALTSTVVVAD